MTNLSGIYSRWWARVLDTVLRLPKTLVGIFNNKYILTAQWLSLYVRCSARPLWLEASLPWRLFLTTPWWEVTPPPHKKCTCFIVYKCVIPLVGRLQNKPKVTCQQQDWGRDMVTLRKPMAVTGSLFLVTTIIHVHRQHGCKPEEVSHETSFIFSNHQHFLSYGTCRCRCR